MDFEAKEKKENGSVISRNENGKKFSLLNRERREVSVFKVDGDLINDAGKKRCDYLFEVGSISKVFYVELKGRNIEDAITQLKATLSYKEMKERHAKQTRECHIVANCVPKAGPGTQSLKRKFITETKVQLIVNTRQHNESI